MTWASSSVTAAERVVVGRFRSSSPRWTPTGNRASRRKRGCCRGRSPSRAGAGSSSRCRSWKRAVFSTRRNAARSTRPGRRCVGTFPPAAYSVSRRARRWDWCRWRRHLWCAWNRTYKPDHCLKAELRTQQSRHRFTLRKAHRSPDRRLGERPRVDAHRSKHCCV